MKPTQERTEVTPSAPRSSSWVTRYTPDLSIRFFSSSAEARRARRPTDAVLLFLALVVLGLVSLFAPTVTTADSEIIAVVDALPGLFGWFWEICYDLLLAWPLVLLIATVVARHRLFLLRDQVIATALAFAVTLFVAGEMSALVDGFTGSDPPPVYPGVRLAFATALIATTAPHLGRPVRRVGRWVIGMGALAAIAMGIALPLGVVAGLAIGYGATALTHLAFGSPGGRPSLSQVAAALRELGIEATDLRQSELGARGVALVEATSAGGTPLVVKVYGRDAWDGQLLTSTWSYLWYRDEVPSLTLSRRQQVEHEAFVTLLAERAGVHVQPVIAAGVVGTRDGVLVVEAEGRPLASLAPDEVTDGLIRDLWTLAVRMHEVGIAHGGLDADRLVVAPDGSARLGGFQAATASATPLSIGADRAQLLVTTSLIAGDERAVAVAKEALGTDGLADLLPYIQPAALSRSTRRSLKDAKYDLETLGQKAASAAGTDLPKLEPLRRVTVGSLLTVAILLAALYFVITALAGIGIDTIVQEIEEADAGWLIAGLLVVPLVPFALAFSTIGAATLPLRLGPVVALEYGIQFIALAVPSSAARVAVSVRFFQKQGAPTTQALTIGLVDSVFGFIVQVLLIVTILFSGLASLDLSFTGFDIDPNGTLLVIAGILLVVLIVVAFAVRRIRTLIAGKLAEARPALAVLRSPTKIAQLLGGNFVAQLLLAIVLGLTVEAFGQHASLAELLLVNTFVSLFSGVMPIPGGIGVSEAAISFCLTAIGIPSDTSVAIAVVYRLLTFYLPPVWGGFAMRWLKRQDYL